VVNIDWDKITIYEVDPACTGSYATGCRCEPCRNKMLASRGYSTRQLRYIPESEWTP
jgi:hypothetical protein